MAFIYIITNKLSGKSYVGQTKNFNQRMKQHKRCKDNDYLHKALRKHGPDAFDYNVLCEVDDCVIDIAEKAYIKTFKTMAPNGYNTSEGGLKPPSRLGIPPWNKGLKYSKEASDKAAAGLKKFYSSMTPDEKKTFYESKRGRKVRPEVRRAASERMKSTKLYNDIRCRDNAGNNFKSMSAAARHYGICTEAVCLSVNENRQLKKGNAKGVQFYKENE